MCLGGYPLRPEDAIRSPGAGVRGDYEIPTTAMRKWTETPSRSNKQFSPLIHLGVHVLAFVFCLLSLAKS